MAIKFDYLLGKLRTEDGRIIISGSSDPASGLIGEWFLNTTSHQIKVYYDNSWQVLHTLSAGENYRLLEDGDYRLLEGGDIRLLEA